jgi:hypothetical protein
LVEEGIRDAKTKGLTWASIEEIGCGSESLGPVGGWHVSLEEEGAGDVIKSAQCTFSFTILRGGVGAGKAEVDPMAS